MTACPFPDKHRHRTFNDALTARDSLEQARGIDIGLRPYRCGNHWHLGHRQDARNRRLRNALRRNQ